MDIIRPGENGGADGGRSDLGSEALFPLSLLHFSEDETAPALRSRSSMRLFRFLPGLHEYLSYIACTAVKRSNFTIIPLRHATPFCTLFRDA